MTRTVILLTLMFLAATVSAQETSTSNQGLDDFFLLGDKQCPHSKIDQVHTWSAELIEEQTEGRPDSLRKLPWSELQDRILTAHFCADALVHRVGVMTRKTGMDEMTPRVLSYLYEDRSLIVLLQIEQIRRLNEFLQRHHLMEEFVKTAEVPDFFVSEPPKQ